MRGDEKGVMEGDVKVSKSPWDKRLLPSQANEVFELIRYAGLNPADFDREEVESETFVPDVKFIHRSSGYFFLFCFDVVDVRSAIFSPGKTEVVFTTPSVNSWRDQLRYFPGWLDNLKREVNSSDLWAAISQESLLIDAASAEDVSNAPFTLEEREQIANQLTEIKEFLFTTQELNESHKEFVTARLNYLKESSERMGRKDWLTNVVGGLLSIAMGNERSQLHMLAEPQRIC